MTKPNRESLKELHLWDFRAVQDVFWIGLGVLLLWFGYHLSGVFVPMLVGFGLAYAINPALAYIEDHWKWPRSMIIASMVAVAAAGLVVVGIILIPVVSDEAEMLADRAPKYAKTLSQRIEDWESPAAVKMKSWLQSQSEKVLAEGPAPGRTSEAVIGIFDVLGGFFGVVTGTVLVPIYFCFFAWYFQPLIETIKDLIPASHREPICRVVGRMDTAVGDFLRGRFFVMVVMMIAFSCGFWLAGVPYWFLIGASTGLLSFIPYLSVIGAGVAILATWIDAQSDGGQTTTTAVLGFPLLAFSVVQLLEGWLLTPWIQSKSMEMNPVAVFIVVLIGGAVGGLYGLLLAIPIAGCGRILFSDVLLPRLQEWANSSDTDVSESG